MHTHEDVFMQRATQFPTNQHIHTNDTQIHAFTHTTHIHVLLLPHMSEYSYLSSHKAVSDSLLT